jgi:hypothetical protein
MRDDIFGMFYPLSQEIQQTLAHTVRDSQEKFTELLAELARQSGHEQIPNGNGISWTDESGAVQVMFFRVTEPGNIDAIRSVYEAVKEKNSPLAFVFVHQVPDGRGTWDIFRLSEQSYMEHCNRISGPGSWCQ